jgi:hypothetical protein
MVGDTEVSTSAAVIRQVRGTAPRGSMPIRKYRGPFLRPMGPRNRLSQDFFLPAFVRF